MLVRAGQCCCRVVAYVVAELLCVLLQSCCVCRCRVVACVVAELLRVYVVLVVCAKVRLVLVRAGECYFGVVVCVYCSYSVSVAGVGFETAHPVLVPPCE